MTTYKLIQESVACVDIASGNFHIHYGHVGECPLQVPKKRIRISQLIPQPARLLVCAVKTST